MIIQIIVKDEMRTVKNTWNLGVIIEDFEREELTPEIKERLEILKELQNQLSQSEHIIDAILDQDVKKALSFSKTQSVRASKPRNTNGVTPAERKERNMEICKKWRKNLTRKYPLSKHSFAKRQSKSYSISVRQIDKIITLFE